ncbi:MAG: hypothetical protein JSS83_15610 [Cyanobacteria bacterium SZAS LIN-3]|nr:hypothetical protein [Cyanobacteria bacterium SZAS LIN-3]
MNQKSINLLCFVGGLAAGLGADFAMQNTVAGAPFPLALYALVVGLGLLIFGAPHRNPRVGYVGWGAIGTGTGIFAPLVLLMLFMVG